MARYNPPQHPDDSRQRQEQTQQIAAIGQQISVPLGDLSHQVIAFTEEVKSNHEKTQRKEKKYRDKSLTWAKWSTWVDHEGTVIHVLPRSAPAHTPWHRLRPETVTRPLRAR